MEAAKRRTDKLAAALAQQIFTGAWPIGGKLPSDTELCSRYRVSRTVVREALRLLTGKGLIEARPRRGTLVAAQNRWALWDRDILLWRAAAGHGDALMAEISDIRLGLEPSLAALAAARADLAANEALQAALRALQSDATQEKAFLSALYAASGNQLALAGVHLAHWAVTERASPSPMTAYRDMTAAIAQNDGAAARTACFQALLL